ncbi:MAG TPA: hypothetical protein GX012_04925 [Acholeplasma sp.]|nr:hypothetical protein [Acholeplasma sp.]
MLELIKKSKKEKSLIAIKAKYNYEALFFYTIDSNEDFYFGVEEFDFRLDGYQIGLMKDFEDLEIVNNFSSQINIKEGLIEQIKPYNINLESFQTIFQDLQSLNNIISIEREYYDDDYFFLIGKIIKADEDSLWFRDFDINGNWNKEINIIPYDEITTIRFNSHYINTWEKYIKEEE